MSRRANIGFFVFAALCLAAGVGGFAYSVSECGLARTLMLGDGALFAALAGMC